MSKVTNSLTDLVGKLVPKEVLQNALGATTSSGRGSNSDGSTQDLSLTITHRNRKTKQEVVKILSLKEAQGYVLGEDRSSRSNKKPITQGSSSGLVPKDPHSASPKRPVSQFEQIFGTPLILASSTARIPKVDNPKQTLEQVAECSTATRPIKRQRFSSTGSEIAMPDVKEFMSKVSQKLNSQSAHKSDVSNLAVKVHRPRSFSDKGYGNHRTLCKSPDGGRKNPSSPTGRARKPSSSSSSSSARPPPPRAPPQKVNSERSNIWINGKWQSTLTYVNDSSSDEDDDNSSSFRLAHSSTTNVPIAEEWSGNKRKGQKSLNQKPIHKRVPSVDKLLYKPKHIELKAKDRGQVGRESNRNSAHHQKKPKSPKPCKLSPIQVRFPAPNLKVEEFEVMSSENESGSGSQDDDDSFADDETPADDEDGPLAEIRENRKKILEQADGRMLRVFADLIDKVKQLHNENGGWAILSKSNLEWELLQLDRNTLASLQGM